MRAWAKASARVDGGEGSRGFTGAREASAMELV